MTKDTPIYEIEREKFYAARTRFSEAIKARLNSLDVQMGVLNRLEKKDGYLCQGNLERYDDLMEKHMELSNELSNLWGMS